MSSTSTPRATASQSTGPCTGAGEFQVRGIRPGFTLIEVLVVITLIGVLMTIAVPMYQGSVVRAREAALKENLLQMRVAIDKFYADNGEYPPALASLAEKRYIRAVPEDPFTGSAETWVLISTDSKAGISDVRSGSELVGRNGIAYAQW